MKKIFRTYKERGINKACRSWGQAMDEFLTEMELEIKSEQGGGASFLCKCVGYPPSQILAIF